MSVIVQAGEPHVARAVGEVAARLDATDVRLGAGAVPHATQDGSLSTGAPSLGRMFFKARPLSDLLEEWLDAKERAASWDYILDKPATFPPSAHTHPWGSVTEKPATFPPSAHTHPWGSVTEKPATFPPSAHTHPAGQITDAPWLTEETEPAFNTWRGGGSIAAGGEAYAGTASVAIGSMAKAAKTGLGFVTSIGYFARADGYYSVAIGSDSEVRVDDNTHGGIAIGCASVGPGHFNSIVIGVNDGRILDSPGAGTCTIGVEGLDHFFLNRTSLATLISQMSEITTLQRRVGLLKDAVESSGGVIAGWDE